MAKRHISVISNDDDVEEEKTAIKEEEEKEGEDRECGHCHRMTPPHLFGRYNCKECEGEIQAKHRDTKRGFLVQCLSNAKKRHKLLATRGRIPAEACALTIDDILEMARLQNNKCFYSGLPLAFCTLIAFQASLERLNPSLGYTKENCRLIVLELNNSSQWSEAVIREHLTLRAQPISNEAVAATAAAACLEKPAKRKPNRPASRMQLDGTEEWHCYKGDHWLALEHMIPTVLTWCKRCNADLKRCSVEARCRQLLYDAKNHTNERNNVADRGKKRAKHAPVTLTLQEIAELIIAQCNRCYYSGAPFDWTLTASRWAASLERLDVTLGYTKANVRLVCRAFNSIDHSAGAKKKEVDPDNKQGWSVAKYAQFLQSVTEKYRVTAPVPTSTIM